MRFKIDIDAGRTYPFALFVVRAGWLRTSWEKLENFESQQKAREFYEKIKDLPEYLA